MSNMRALYDNLADAGTVTATSGHAAFPAASMQNPHVRRRWKGQLADSESIFIDLGSVQSIDLISLHGLAKIVAGIELPMTAAAIRQVRASETNAALGDAYDSLSAAGHIKAAYGQMIAYSAAPYNARYIQIDLSEAGAQAIMCGRVVVGLTSGFTINFSYGWGYGYVDLSRKRKSAGGQTFVERDDRYRVLSLSFDALDEADRYGMVHEIDRLNGVSTDVLFLIDPASSDITRDTIWGLLQDTSPSVQPNIAFFSKSYQIEERL